MYLTRLSRALLVGCFLLALSFLALEVNSSAPPTSTWSGWPMTDQNPQRTKVSPVAPDFENFEVTKGLYLGIQSGIWNFYQTLSTAVSSKNILYVTTSAPLRNQHQLFLGFDLTQNKLIFNISLSYNDAGRAVASADGSIVYLPREGGIDILTAEGKNITVSALAGAININPVLSLNGTYLYTQQFTSETMFTLYQYQKLDDDSHVLGWSKAVESSSGYDWVWSGLTLSQDESTLFASTSKVASGCEFLAFDTENEGNLLWNFSQRDTSYSATTVEPVVTCDGSVLFWCTNVLYAFDPATGAQRWQTEVEVSGELGAIAAVCSNTTDGVYPKHAIIVTSAYKTSPNNTLFVLDGDNNGTVALQYGVGPNATADVIFDNQGNAYYSYEKNSFNAPQFQVFSTRQGEIVASFDVSKYTPTSLSGSIGLDGSIFVSCLGSIFHSWPGQVVVQIGSA